MPERVVLIDNDLFIVLAAAGVVDQVLEMLGCTRANARCLDALPHIVRKNKRLKRKYDAETLIKIEAEARTTPVITQAPSADTAAMLENIDGIDYGEAVMYGLLYEQDVIYLASNDKRAMRTICSTIELKPLRDKVAGRVICLESILKCLLLTHRASEVANLFAPVLHADTMLQVVFTHRTISTPGAAMEALESYLNDLMTCVGEDFLCVL